MIETVKEKELRLNHRIVCPMCNAEFESDAELLFFTEWEYNTGKAENVEKYQCPVCSETRREISDFYE
jgi:ribosomal protein L37AE/L43A